jgi:hypothetical protein
MGGKPQTTVVCPKCLGTTRVRPVPQPYDEPLF